MSSSRYSTLSIVGFALLASACADDMQVQRPVQINAIDLQSEEPTDDKELAADAGVEQDAGSAEEGDAGQDDDGDDDEQDKGMPCEIEQLLRTRCQGCHSAQAKNGVPLMTLENLMAPAKVDPNVPTYERVAARMASSERPMPPMGKGMPVSAEELALFQAWVDDGAPADGCEQE